MSHLAIIDLNDVTGKHLNTTCFKFLRGFPQKPKHFNHIFAGNKNIILVIVIVIIVIIIIIIIID